MTLAPEELDPNSELRRKARANVATFEPLTGEELAEISRLFAGTNVPAAASHGGMQRPGRGGASTPTAVTTHRQLPPLQGGVAAVGATSGPRRVVPTGAGRDASSIPKS